MCQRADAVVCSTAEQKEDIQPFSQNVRILLDFHFKLMSAVKTDYFVGDTINLVWEGLPSNLKFVSEIKKVLESLSKKHKIALHIVTDLKYGKYMDKYCIKQTLPLAKRIFENSYLHEWKAKTFAPTVSSFDMAVIPIPLNKPFGLDSSLAIGKPENKLLLFWRMGIPVVVSATPAYKRAMGQCGLSMACQNSDEWFDTLDKYLNDESARREAGQKGKAFTEKYYSEEIMLSKWDELFASVLFPRNNN
jgi:glycosyltransferase involved in cell wall biosynthesis